MAQKIHVPPLSEPQIVPCLFCSGIEIELLDSVVRVVGWVDLPTAEGDQPERRIVARMVMPADIARRLARDLQRSLARGGH